MVADTPTAAACSKVRLAGLSTNWSSLADAYSAKAPVHHPNTSSPGRSCVTSLPTASTVPAMSVPGTWFFGLRSPVASRMRYGEPVMRITVTDVDGRGMDADQDLACRRSRADRCPGAPGRRPSRTCLERLPSSLVSCYYTV